MSEILIILLNRNQEISQPTQISRALADSHLRKRIEHTLKRILLRMRLRESHLLAPSSRWGEFEQPLLDNHAPHSKRQSRPRCQSADLLWAGGGSAKIDSGPRPAGLIISRIPLQTFGGEANNRCATWRKRWRSGWRSSTWILQTSAIIVRAAIATIAYCDSLCSPQLAFHVVKMMWMEWQSAIVTLLPSHRGYHCNRRRL